MPSCIEFPDDPPTYLAEWMVYFGLPEDMPVDDSVNILMRHVMANAGMVVAAKDVVIDHLQTRLDSLTHAPE